MTRRDPPVSVSAVIRESRQGPSQRRSLGTAWLACIDPGHYRCGLALFGPSGLRLAQEPQLPRGCLPQRMARHLLDVVDGFLADNPGPIRYLAEWPQSYAERPGREGTLEGLRDVLRWVEILRTDGGRPIRYATPSKWKGQVPKDIHHERILAVLTPSEIRLVNLLSRDRDALDAVGMGLWELGRVGRGGRSAVQR